MVTLGIKRLIEDTLHNKTIIMLNVIVISVNVNMLNIIWMSVIMLNVVAPVFRVFANGRGRPK